MSELPDKITRIDVLRVERGRQKVCQCKEPCYEVDTENHIVTCLDCGAIVDPFVAITKIATYYDNLNNQVERLLDQAKEIANYKPHLRVIKDMEHQYRTMVPMCPHCHKAFDFTEIAGWYNKKYYAQSKLFKRV